MRPRLRRHPLAALTLVAIALAVPACARADWQRGINLTTYGREVYGSATSDASLALARADGNDSVAIVPTWFQDTASSNAIAPSPVSTTSDSSVLHAMQTARSLGMRVILKPHDHTQDGTWVGALTPTDVDAWFASYREFIYHYADLAQRGGASALVVGTELRSLSGPAYTARWRDIIAGVRQRFSGALTYAATANGDEYEQVRFWDRLDYIGVDAYFSLTSADDPSVADLVSAWTRRGYISSLSALAQTYGKQVLFTEIGYRSIAGAAITPQVWWTQGTYDMSAQADAYEAAFEAFQGRGWFAGMYWWAWPAELPTSGWNGDMPPLLKPAETVMREWNARLAREDASPPEVVSLPPVAVAPPAAPRPAAAARHKHHTPRHHRRRSHNRRHTSSHRRAHGKSRALNRRRSTHR